MFLKIDPEKFGPPDLSDREMTICSAMSRWIDICRKEGRFVDSTPTYADITKSRLFWWLLSGHEPLPHPPPTCFSCPWYELIIHAGPHTTWDARLLPDEPYKGKFSVAHCLYDLVEDHGDGSYTVEFKPWRFLVKPIAPKWDAPQWSIELVRDVNTLTQEEAV